MSPRESNSEQPRGILVRRQAPSIYNTLLLIALIALVISSLIMLFECARYGFQFKPPASMRVSAIAMQFDLKV